jgi:hypothetical protein
MRGGSTSFTASTSGPDTLSTPILAVAIERERLADLLRISNITVVDLWLEQIAWCFERLVRGCVVDD